MKTLFFILLLFVSNVVISQCDLFIEDIMVSSVNEGETQKYALLNNMHFDSKLKSYLCDNQMPEGFNVVLLRSLTNEGYVYMYYATNNKQNYLTNLKEIENHGFTFTSSSFNTNTKTNDMFYTNYQKSEWSFVLSTYSYLGHQIYSIAFLNSSL